jgi:hypothetical protein
LNPTFIERGLRLRTNVVLLPAVCIGFLFGPVIAESQTRINASQLPSLQGAVQGRPDNNSLRDINSAVDHLTGSQVTGGINSAISACGTTSSCSIIIPPSYSTSEAVPGFSLDPNNPAPGATTPGNVTIFDQRYGDARMAVNPRGYQDGLLSSPNGWVYSYYAKQSPGVILTPLYILQNSWDGGTNAQASALGYWDKTTYAPISLTNYSHTPGQHLGFSNTVKSYSTGDVLGLANYITCFGGFNAQADEGCELQDNQVFMGNVAYEGTLTGSPTIGGNTVSVSPTQGAHTQGAGRFLIKMNSGTITAGTVSAVSSSGTALTTITGTGTSWPVSTMIGQLGTAVSAPGATTVTPTGFTVGGMAQLTTSTQVCVADGGAFEMIYPSAVTGASFTATFAKVHPATATIAAGGVCGYLLDLTADDVVDSTFTSKIQPIIGTLRFAWPAIASTSATSLQLYVAGGGSYQQLATRWDASSANGYVLYPMAEVTSVQKNGGLSDTLTLGPNNVAWAAGDSVEEPIYPAQHLQFANNVVESYFPNFPAANGGFGIAYNFPMQGTDTMMNLQNSTPVSMYKSNGGKYTSPIGIHLGGQTSYGVTFDSPGDQWTIGIGCNQQCTGTPNIIAAANATNYDYLQYDEGNRRWNLTANGNTAQYTFGSSQMLTPFPHVSLGSDSNGVGYVASQSLRSGNGANTDLSGELNYNNTTAVSYTFTGSYSSHPECWAEPQFDSGTGNRYWITYNGTSSMTINFGAAVTGSVSYGCTGRN